VRVVVVVVVVVCRGMVVARRWWWWWCMRMKGQGGRAVPAPRGAEASLAAELRISVPEAAARDLHRRLRESLPGYLVPRLVREVPGERAKVPIG
jgi:hypothetical protein